MEKKICCNLRSVSFILSFLLFSIYSFIPLNAFASLLLTGMEPSSGPVGTQVVLTGTGFDPAENYTVKINDLPCMNIDVGTSTISFIIPSGAETGNITVADNNGQNIAYFLPFTVTRIINGVFQIPTGVAIDGYYVGSSFSQTVPGADGSFSVTVSDKGINTVVAASGDDDPVFLAVVTSASTSVTIDSASTASALLFLSPWISSSKDSVAQDILTAINTLAETGTLAGLINSLSVDSKDLMDVFQIKSAYKTALLAYLNNPVVPLSNERSALSFESGSPANTAFKYLNPPPEGGGEARDFTTPYLVSTLYEPDNEHPGYYRLDIDGKEGTPLDWSCLLYELAPYQFPKGLNSVDEWNWRTKPYRISDKEIDRTRIGAKLYSRYLDLIDLALGQVFSVKTADLLIPAYMPGIYIARAYSGNLFYGTEWWDYNGYQGAFIDGLGGGRQEWNNALYANMTVAVLDAVAVILDAKNFFEGREFADLIVSITYEVQKAISLLEQQKGSGGKITKSEYWEVYYATVRAVLKKIYAKIQEQSVLKIIKGVGKTFLKIIDISGKISTAAQAAERMAGLYGPHTLAMESTIVVIGKPFAPFITSFSPRRGMEGTVVVIEGHNFDPGKTDEGKYKTKVFFGKNSTDPENPTVKHEAEVLYATEHTLTVKVPYEAYTAVIYVSTEKGTTGTYTLNQPYTVFEVIGPMDDVVLTVDPDPVVAGSVMKITGSDFPQGVGFDYEMNDDAGTGGQSISERGAPYKKLEVIFDGDQENPVMVQNVSPTEILVKAPEIQTTPETHSVHVKMGNSINNQSKNFTVYDPSIPPDSNFGTTIYVTSTADNTNADGDITLREAILIAKGALGRDITRHEEDEPEGTVREEDHVGGETYGAPYRDIIYLVDSITSINPSSILPSPGSNDVFHFEGLTISGNGSGTAWNLNQAYYTELYGATFQGFSDGVSMDGATGNLINNVTFKNISGTGAYFANDASGNRLQWVNFENITGKGIHLASGAHGNNIYKSTINGCGGTGVYFDGNAFNNKIHDMKETGTGSNSHGLHMSGANVYYNEMSLTGVNTKDVIGCYNNNGGYGILIDGGAHHNLIHPGTVKNNKQGGILVTGTGTDFNVIGRESDIVPRASDIYDNLGSGVRLEAGVDHTVLRYLSVAGNDGDGIVLEGPDCSYNRIQSCSTGVDLFTGDNNNLLKLRNEGSGIHLMNGAHHNLIGSRFQGSFGWRNSICGNRDYGVLIEGADSSYNVINQSHFGSISPAQFTWAPFFPNEKDAIVLKNGTHNNIIGDRHKWLDNHIVAHENGAGILLEGEGTDNNLIMGNQIGVEHMDSLGPGNKIGIYLKDGPQGNVIGRMGDHIPEDVFPPPENWDDFEDIFTFLSGNVISNNTEAGIVLENCGSQIDDSGNLSGANIIINNYIGCREDSVSAAGNEVGIKILAQAAGNIIGGNLDGEGNRIDYNRKAGIEIDGCSINNAQLSNRIINNSFYGTGYNQAVWDISPAEGFKHGIGILVHNNSAGHIIGGASERGNRIESSMVGIYIDSSSSISVLNNSIAGKVFTNSLAGVVLKDSTGCIVGSTESNGKNIIYDIGSGNNTDGGIIISGGNNNSIISNYIGTDTNAIKGINGWGIIIKDSSGNIIGHPQKAGGNVITGNALGGILLTGSSSTDNILQRNLIGTDRKNSNNTGNNGNGIQIENGASDNLVGGTNEQKLKAITVELPAPNTITGNNGMGVLVDGATSIGNSILFNSITDNTGKGIDLNGGNASIPAPLIINYDGLDLYGTVDNTSIPAGSTIQVFSDPVGEGNQYLGQTTTRSNGTWSLKIGSIVYPSITATVTHVTDGHTSEFSAGHSANSGALIIARTDGINEPSQQDIDQLTNAVVFDLTMTAVNTDVQVKDIQIQSSGSLKDDEQISAVRLYRDNDGSGTVSEGDDLIGGGDGETFDTDNGNLTLFLESAFLTADESQRWILTIDLAIDIPSGINFQTGIPSATAINAVGYYPFSVAITDGNFPIQSDQFETIPTLADAIIILKTICRMTPQGINKIHDYNNDGKIGLQEAIYILQKVSKIR